MSLDYLHNRGFKTDQHLWLLTDQANGLLDGKLRVTGEFTLTAGATTTVVNDNKFESEMLPVLTPLTANAAAALGTTYVSARTQGSFTITHANNAQTDRSFGYVRLG